MEWGRTEHARRAVDLLVAAGSATLCVTVNFAQARGLSVYPWLASPFVPTPRLEGLLPWGMAGFVREGMVPAAGSALLLWRRRWPVAIAVVLVIAATLMPLIPAALAALFTVASMRPARTTVAVTALALLPMPLYPALYASPSPDTLATTMTGGVLVGAAVGWGLFLRGLHDA
ncbi:hypothetical protein ACWCP6_20390 [Streptomyces sp. NPDC002004]